MSKVNWVTSFDENNNYIISLENKYKTSCKLSLNEIINNTIENRSEDIFNFSVENEAINNKMKEILLITEYTNISDLDLLEKEALIIIYINRFLLKNKLKETDKQFFIDLFIWIKNLSDFFSTKLNLTKIVHSKRFKDEFLINRCSYKFCNYKDNCEFNYDVKNTKGKKCNSDHYVHNMVCADCDSLINYLLNHDLEKIDHHNEMMKCINTLMFVINHMYNELKNKIFYSKNKNISELHINNNITEKVKVCSRFETLNDGGKAEYGRNDSVRGDFNRGNNKGDNRGGDNRGGDNRGGGGNNRDGDRRSNQNGYKNSDRRETPFSRKK